MAALADDSTYFPATVEEYLNTLAPAEHDAVKAALKHEPMIWRLHPHRIGDQATGIQGFVPWLLADRGVTISPEDLDAVFGVIAPPPIYVPS